MKKLYNNKGKVHPTSPPAAADPLSLLPAAILTLTVALTAEDREVLDYLISCFGTSSNNHKSAAFAIGGDGGHGGGGSGGDHPPQPHCSCFRCYMSYWVRWDQSPNRQLIHEILDAYEDGIFNQSKKKKKKKSGKVKKERTKRVFHALDEEILPDSGESERVEVSRCDGGEGEEDGEVAAAAEPEKGSVRKIMSFIGERIWGVWGV